jgi:hypothetical protein
MISPISPKTSESIDHDPESDFAVLDLCQTNRTSDRAE